MFVSKSKICLRWLCLTLFFSVSLSHAATPIADYFTDTWSTQDGLPHNSINAIAQTSDGYLWFATWEGVARYNGREFRFYERSTRTGIIDSGTRVLVSDDHNGLWVAGARGGITYRQGNEWQPQSNAQSMVNHLVHDKEGNLWLAVEGLGVFCRPNPNSLSHESDEAWVIKNISAYRLLEDSQGRMWAATAKGLFHLNSDNSDEDVLSQHGLPTLQVNSMLETPDQNLIIATNKGAYVLTEETITLLHPDIAEEAITTLMLDTEGSLWLGTINKGVMRLTHGQIETLDTQQGLPNNRILSMLQDLEGSIWIGTNGGLMRLRNAPFTAFTKDRQLIGNYVRSVIDIGQNSVLVGSSEGLSLIKDNRAQNALSNTDIAMSVLSFAKRQHGGAWVGTYLNGLMYWQDQALTPYLSQEDGLPNNEIRAILEDRKGNLWIGTTNGLVKQDPAGTLYTYSREQGLPDNYIMALTEDDRGQIWVGTGVGVAIVSENTVHTVPIHSQEGAGYAFGFWVEPGYVWITTDRGLIRYRQQDAQLNLVGRNTGLPIDKFFQVIHDGKDGLWLTSNRGIWRISYIAAHAAANGEQQSIAFEHFSESDGMASAQANGGSNPAAVATSDGKLWFATAKGVAMVNSQDVSKENTLQLPIVIESLHVDGRPLPFNKHIELPANTNRVVFHYAGLGYVMSSRIEYRTQLVGFEQNWALRGKNTLAEYTNLAPGEYQFIVSARYPYSDWNTAEKIFSFEVLPHFWQRLGVQILFIVLVMALFAGAMYWRLHRLKQSEIRLKAIIDKQTHALRQKSEDFQRQANEDDLTSLPNRRAFDRLLSARFAQAKQDNTQLMLIIMDIDHFKKINDTYSHLAGDKVIQSLAKTLLRLESHSVHVARWGGEEFTLVIEGLGESAALSYCETIRKSIENTTYEEIAPGLVMTVSMGGAFTHQVDHYQDLLKLADQALYRAKDRGRNRIELWHDEA